MHRYILKRLLMLIPVIIGVSFLVFFIMALSPGNPARTILGESAPIEAVEALEEELGLNDPIIQRYANYMLDLVQGDMGESYKSGRPVFSEVMSRFPATIQLALGGMIFAIMLSIPIGIISATKQYSALDGASMIFALLGVAIPNFWLGLMLIIVFSLNFGWLPSGGMGGWQNFVLPVITLGTGCMANITRTTRSSMLEVIRQDYIRTAKAKGVKQKIVIGRHALNNALIPVVTVIGLQFGALLGGAVLTETVFSWPGVGSFLINSIKAKDTPSVMGCVIIFSICFSIVNLLVDILYAYIDPRIKSQYS
ncbi:MAG: peptide ABC transporter permease [Candidatus Epulonipiscium fishelsonii]|nr:MAG: peptide ABC transporter permease [Epulopiscium sp. AS2M-Bin002]